MAEDGFRVPAEEAPHKLTFMQWPVTPEVYGTGRYRRQVQNQIARIANTVAAFEPVIMLAAPEDHARARRKLSGSVELWDIPADDLWCRDSGPLFGRGGSGKLSVRQLNFNGWGRYNLPNDERIAARVAERLGLPLFDSGITGEAGGAEADGHGLLMVNESSWVNSNRNPGLSRTEIEVALLAAYGADRLIWGKGVKGQDVTDDHIDGLARFTGDSRVLMMLAETPVPDDPFDASARQLQRRLLDAGLQVDTLPWPEAGRIRDPDSQCSYVNFYVCNGGVIAPQSGDKRSDALAAEALRRHYPGRELVMLDTDLLAELGGGIHCATQQMPA
ncbi:agmatine deiminase family protein [Leisingera daeponensis]|uniref:agmatine deiminase family protein n=1 Tax=Leisingera daeponensis TaxID=405746 RepID=UPI0028F6D5CF|nr:agmatine deiminase family protein [Leisingera daeponensis]